MSDNINPSKLRVRYEIDKKIPVTFTIGVDCVDEIVYADVYDIGVGFVDNVNRDYSVTGDRKDRYKTIVLDFSEIPVGDNYSLILRTSETGLINKSPLVVLAQDGYSDEELTGEAPEPVIEFSEDYTIIGPGIYIFSGDTESTVTINDDITGEIKILTLATANLNISGTISDNHLGVIQPGNPMTTFIWHPTLEVYAF